jgi:putative DNA methylase
MIPKDCKRLAEVDFPIAVVSKHSAREKSIRHGHPSTLHLWWARRPLAACRAMLLALLLPDPCDSLCPKEFKERAMELLRKVQGNPGRENIDLRRALLKFIGDFSNWDLSSNQTYLEVGRGLVKAAHPEETPLVVDPFAGGGSIPLEALRIGCDAFASDLNPVACLILKVMLEDIPRYGREKIKVKKQSGEEVEAEGLAEALRIVGKEIKDKAETELRDFYPDDPDGSKPIAYLWARTVRCEAPNCGAEIPLMRSFWLCKKPSRKRALRWKVKRQEEKGRSPEVVFTVFEPNSENEVPEGTVSRAKATCPCCGTVLAPERVRAQLTTQRGGADVLFDKKGHRIGGARLLAVVTLQPLEQGRLYRLATKRDYLAVWRAQRKLEETLNEWEEGGMKGLCPVPDEPISLNEIRRVSVPLYGAKTWGDIFTMRQKQSLYTYTKIIREIDSNEACSRLCSLALDRLLILLSAHCRWKPTGESLIDMFGRHAIGMVWDFAESTPGFGSENIFSSWLARYGTLAQLITPLMLKPGHVEQSDATQSYLPEESSHIWFTDPPYYDSIPYAHLSDSFYVWLKRSLSQPPSSSKFSDLLSPKDAECVVDRPHRLSTSLKDEVYFEKKIAEAATVGRRVLSPLGCACVVFAHKTTEGWEALLSGIIGGGWCITASWPIATELSTRLNARDTASLATSVHLVCRPRAEDAPVGDWGEVLRELPRRVGDWMERLQNEGVRGADLGEYLEKVWEVVGRTALEHVLGTPEAQARNSTAGALEEDARLTALFLWTLQSTNGGNSKEVKPESEDDEVETDEEEETPKKRKAGYNLIFDVVRRFAQPLGIHLPEWEGRIIETEKGVVHLLSVTERSKQLFGEESGQAFAEQLEKAPAGHVQISLFPRSVKSSAPQIRGRGRKMRKDGEVTDESLKTTHEATTLDRVHAAMLLQSTGRTNALRALLKAEQDRGSDFLRLANALSALYPRESEEKRLLDAMLLAVPR